MNRVDHYVKPFEFKQFDFFGANKCANSFLPADKQVIFKESTPRHQLVWLRASKRSEDEVSPSDPFYKSSPSDWPLYCLSCIFWPPRGSKVPEGGNDCNLFVKTDEWHRSTCSHIFSFQQWLEICSSL